MSQMGAARERRYGGCHRQAVRVRVGKIMAIHGLFFFLGEACPG